jgi:dihydroxyacetone kinase-like predicted kinase
LAAAGVVDAGGRGLTLLLEALLAVVLERSAGRLGTATYSLGNPVQAPEGAAPPLGCGATADLYEVMYLLDGANEAGVSRLRAELARLGDCVAVVGTSPAWDGPDALWNVHVHCADPNVAIAAGMQAGRPHHLSVVRFADQVADRAAHRERYQASHAVLVLVTGTGMAQLCRREGAVTAPATSSPADLLTILAATRARHITVLAEPGALSVAETAAAQARDTGQDVKVVAVASAVHVLAAMAVHDDARHPALDRDAMTDAAAALRCGELIITRREPAGFVGILDEQVVLINGDALVASCQLVSRLLRAGGELVTVLLGQDAPDGIGERLCRHIEASAIGTEVSVYAGGQPSAPLLLGVE